MNNLDGDVELEVYPGQVHSVQAPSTPSESGLEDIFQPESTPLRPLLRTLEDTGPSSDLTAIMEKVKHSKVARFADKLAVDSEPGLTTAQLMLANHDLKPVEPERRQWRGACFNATGNKEDTD